eukprot:6750016-Prymnesium_polylepis.1
MCGCRIACCALPTFVSCGPAIVGIGCAARRWFCEGVVFTHTEAGGGKKRTRDWCAAQDVCMIDAIDSSSTTMAG